MSGHGDYFDYKGIARFTTEDSGRRHLQKWIAETAACYILPRRDKSITDMYYYLSASISSSEGDTRDIEFIRLLDRYQAETICGVPALHWAWATTDGNFSGDGRTRDLPDRALAVD